MIRRSFIAEQPFLAGMGIERADADPRPQSPAVKAESSHGPRRPVGSLASTACGVNRRKYVSQGHVQRHVHDAQSSRPTHRRRPGRDTASWRNLDPAQLGQQFGMARIMMPRQPQGGLVQRRGDDPVHSAGQRQFDGRDQGVVGRLSGS